MIKHTVTYTDFSNPPKEVKEDLYFNMFKPELVKFEKNYPRGYAHELTRIQEITDEKLQSDAFYEFVTSLVLAAYGKKTEDGRGFEKSPEMTRAFENSLAYEALLDSFTSAVELFQFIVGIFPAGVKDQPGLAEIFAALDEETSKAKSELPAPDPANGLSAPLPPPVL